MLNYLLYWQCRYCRRTGGAGDSWDAATCPSKIFGQYWLDLGSDGSKKRRPRCETL